MKKLAKSIYLIAFVGTTLCAQTQPLAFYKRCLVTSITGGPSSALYTTRTNDGRPSHSDRLTGSIDPIIMEYGITNRLGIGFSHGGETYYVNANDFYNANVQEGSEYMFSTTKYLTLDLSYHPFVTKRLDLALFTGIGYYNVSGSCYNNNFDDKWSMPALYNYNGRGAVARVGVRSRFYLTKRFGVMGLLYAFNGYAKEKQKPNTVSDAVNNSSYSTSLTGVGAELGICYRLFKQKGVVKETAKVKKAQRIKKVRKEKEEQENDKAPLFRLVWD